MGKRILLPIDGREHAQRAYDLACDLFPEGTYVLLHVINPADASVSIDGAMASFPEGWYQQQQDHAAVVFDEIENQTGENIDIERFVEVGKSTRKILDVIESEDIDHVVMSTHGRQGVSRLLLGSTAEGVIRCSSVPVTIAS